VRLHREKRRVPLARVGNAWADFRALLRHPKRWLIPVSSAALLCLLIYLRIADERVPWQVGQRAPRTVIANADTSFEDTEATARKRREARESVPLAYDERTAAAARETRQAVTAVFVLANTARREGETADARLSHLRDSLQLPLSPQTLTTLVAAPDADLPIIEDIATRLATDQMGHAVPDKGNALNKARSNIAEGGAGLTERKPLVDAAVEIAQQVIRPNDVYNPALTAAAQEAAEKRVEPVRTLVRRNEVVIDAGDRIEQVHLDMLRALGKTTYGSGSLLLRVLASVATVVALLFVLGYYLRRYRRRYATSPRCTGIVLGSLVVAAFVARMASGSQFAEAAILAALATLAIVLAALLDAEVAMVASMFMAFFADMAAPSGDPRLLVTAAAAGIVAAFTAGAGGGRTSLIVRTAAVCGLSNGFLAGMVSTVFGLPIQHNQVGFAVAGGVLASLIAAGAILVLERPLKITTELRLLELSNPSEPILKQLTVEAPGTYAASVAVGNLAEAAAEAIGADALLARVGSYYHDIGKLKRPYYFIENQQGGPNPHDRLTPHLSARVITAHVRDGLEIAEDIGLPEEIQAFMGQHHGTTLVEYFYEKAIQSTHDPSEIMESAFRYDGPKPRTRETAILMVADTVEAASRTLSNPDIDAIRTLVRNLIQHRIDDGQFDECNLTFADIHTIQDALVRSLMGTFHQRVKYPAQLVEEHELVTI